MVGEPRTKHFTPQPLGIYLTLGDALNVECLNSSFHPSKVG